MVSPTESFASSRHRYAPGDVIAAKYRLECELGEGGMGTVWRAFNLQLEAPVALKLIRAGLDRDLLTMRLKQEARATAKLGHPAIVRVFDVGESEFGDPFIVMELLNGQSLASLLASEHRLVAVRALQLLLPVADALAVAHAKGIIHRDLKPDNVFIAIEDDRVQPKLVDFGIVKLSDRTHLDKHLTQAGTVVGSPDYMSPEQARGREDIDHRTDIWSFAVVLYETLAGVTPFAGASYNALLRSIVEDEPPSLLDHLASDPQLWEIVRRGLAKPVDQRYGSMAEFGCALAAWLLGQGVFEDVAGGLLEAKWLARGRAALAPTVSRSSFSSLTGQAPESGVRVARPPSANAPTLGLPADGQAATNPSQPIRSELVLAATLALGVLLVAALIAILSVRPGAAEPTLVQPAHQATPAKPHLPASAAPTVSPEAPRSPAAPQAESPRAQPLAAHAQDGHRRALPARAVASDAPRNAEKVKPSAAADDLLTPY